MSHNNLPIVVDICWTLYNSNTTYDFLDQVIHKKAYKRLRNFFSNQYVHYINLVLLKIFHVDIQRWLAMRFLSAIRPEEIKQMARDFVTNYLEKRKITESWNIISGRKIIIASGTITSIAQAVAEELGALAVYSGDIYKRELIKNYSEYDIITDNISDLPLIKKANKAYIVTYNNKKRWEKFSIKNVEYITNEISRY